MNKNIFCTLSAVIFASALVACGGGGSGSSIAPTPTTVTVTCPNGTSKTAATADLAIASCAVPVMLSVSPVTGNASVSVDTFASIDVTTDSTLDLSSITASNITLKAGLNTVAGVVSAVGTKAFKFSPSGKLSYGQAYTFSASVKDVLGRTLSISSTFTAASISCVSPQIPNNAGNACVVSQELACAYVKQATITYPPEYNGAFSIPTATVRLPASVVRSMAFLDDYPTNANRYPPTNSECTDQNLYARSLWKESLNRIQKDGAARVWIYNWAGFDDFAKPTWGLTKTFIAMSDSNFQFIVDEAKKLGLEVFYSQQFDFVDLKGNYLTPAETLQKSA